MGVLFFVINSAFLFSLLLVNSNKIMLLFSLAYLIILLKKTQNYKLSLFLLFINLLPFIIGRNILEITLLSKKEIYGFSLFDVKYFVPIYLSDLFLFLIYQNYFSKKLFNKKLEIKTNKISRNFKISIISLFLFLLLILLRSINHEFGNLLIFGSLIIVKYILIFSLPLVIDFKKNKDRSLIYQSIASISFFQTILVFIEQLKGGNLGSFIENNLTGLEIGTFSSESIDLLRANGTFNEPNITAIFLLMNSVLLINFAISNFKKKNKSSYLYLIVSFLSMFAIIFTGSRSLYGLSFLFIIFYLVKYRKKTLEISKKLLKNKFFTLVTLLLLGISSPYLLARINSLKNVLSSDGSISYRRELNNHVLSMSSKNFLGIGLDLTPYYLAKNFKTVDNQFLIFDQAPAHNIIIQIFTETGALACISFLFFVYFVLRRGFKKSSYSFSLAALAYFLAAQFHPVFTNHYELTAFFFLYLGLSLDENY